MSEINRNQVNKAQSFINQVKEFLIEPLEEGVVIKEGKKIKPSLEVFIQILDNLILNNIIESYEDFEEDIKVPDYDLIPYFFHEFINCYIEYQKKILKFFKKTEINFNWIYNIFTNLNTKSDHFKLRFESINLLIKNLDSRKLDISWFDTDLLKKNYLELLETDNEYFFKLKILILMVLRLQKRKIIDIKI